MLNPDTIPAIPGLIIGLSLAILVIRKGWYRA